MDELLESFDTISFETLKDLAGIVEEDMEKYLCEMIMSQKLKGFKISQGYLVRTNPLNQEGVAQNLITKIHRLGA